MFILSTIIAIGFFILLKDTLKLFSEKAIIRQIITGAVFTGLYIANLLYNWGYFKQYWGPETEAYYAAKNIAYVLIYIIWILIIIGLCSVIVWYKKKPE